MDGVGTQVMGPWNPKCQVRPIGAIRYKPNPISDIDINPITGAVGSGALPLRPQPRNVWTKGSAKDQAQGVYYPSYRLAQQLRDGKFGDFDQNFSQSELAWNRGASQQDEGELKEAYFDIEMFDSRLWLRLGKQTVVWGKTELFRNQDQWNPQDLALASLPSLEESRIGLWMARAVWHFWDVGPLEDVRAEFVTIFDQFEPTDIGRCGEPYAPNPVCNKTLGLFIHGLTGFGIAGEIRPPDPWKQLEGDRGGRPPRVALGPLQLRSQRLLGLHGSALPGDAVPLLEERRSEDGTSALGNVDGELQDRKGVELPHREERAHPSQRQPAALPHDLRHQHRLLESRSECLRPDRLHQPEPGGSDSTSLSPTVAVAVGAIVSGQDPNALFGITGGGLFLELAEYGRRAAQAEVQPRRRPATRSRPASVTPLVSLVVDPNDGPAAVTPIRFQNLFTQFGLSPFLTDEQEGLLGCGPFYGTNCDIEGVDLMNAEASALMQSFPGFPGTSGSHWDTRDSERRPARHGGLPGRSDLHAVREGQALTSCRAAGGRVNPGYDIDVDGSTFGPDLIAVRNIYQRVHPFTGQEWNSEMAIASWNTLMALVALSSPAEPGKFLITDFNPSQPFAERPLLLRHAPVLQERPVLLPDLRNPAQHDSGGGQRALRPSRLDLGGREGDRAALPEAQHPRLRHGLRRGLHQIELGHRVHLGE